MILLDTSVLLYALGDVHPLRDPCRRLLRAHQDGRIQATSTVEALQEFLHVRSRRRPRAEAVNHAANFMRAFQLWPTRPVDLRLGLILFHQHQRLGAFDAVLAAVALNRGAEALVSGDRAFEVVSGLRWIDPASTDLPDLLGL